VGVARGGGVDGVLAGGEGEEQGKSDGPHGDLLVVGVDWGGNE
jgi:hypothetical protein